jgi:8-oxo-dGTP pyrophosphatase MutT (NUDIX family)
MTQSKVLIERIASRLLAAPEAADRAKHREFDGRPLFNADRPTMPAAVLVALINRAEGFRVLYTERSSELQVHSGQVAFPGGKIDAADTDAAGAAMREADEEVGLRASDARVIGFLPNYLTVSNYLVTPVVADVHPTAPFRANPGEVTGMFEVPLAFLVPEENYTRLSFVRGRTRRSSWRIDHDGHTIWGITAGLTRLFRDTALIGEEAGNGGG